MLKYDGQIIYVDPYSKVASFTELPKADHIWITHAHFDHLDAAAISAIEKPSTRFISDAHSAQKLYGAVTILGNGDQDTIGQIHIKAVPAYNIVRERAPGLKYHPAGIGNGYVVDLAGFHLYIAGDTEYIPEMSTFGSIDVALLPVMLPYTMSPDEAVAAALALQPEMVLPYHTDKSNAMDLARKLEGCGIQVRITLP
jgi:L-ascorbate metabolism protein UlaG (beta-lactamase superfamily)